MWNVYNQKLRCLLGSNPQISGAQNNMKKEHKN